MHPPCVAIERIPVARPYESLEHHFIICETSDSHITENNDYCERLHLGIMEAVVDPQRCQKAEQDMDVVYFPPSLIQRGFFPAATYERTSYVAAFIAEEKYAFEDFSDCQQALGCSLRFGDIPAALRRDYDIER